MTRAPFRRRLGLCALASAATLACGEPPPGPSSRTSALVVTPLNVRGEQGDEAGAAIARAGDLDGDGFEDIAIGRPGYASDTGRVTIVYGASYGLSTRSTPLGGPEANGRFGASIAFLGDVDGDGRGDLAVGAPGVSAPQLEEGAAFVYFADDEGSLTTRQRWRMEPNAAGRRFGTRVAPAGDVNGDERADLIVVGVDATGHGEVSLYRGIAGTLESTPSWNVAGTSAMGAGDVDGDGLDDVVVGDPHAGSGGACALFLGREDAVLGDARTTHEGAPGERLGAAVAILGDVDGDGLADYACGGPDRDGGRVLVVLGDPARAALEITGAALGLTELGRAMAPAGDVDADGLADVVVGAHDHALVLAGGLGTPLAHELWRGTCLGCASDASFGAVVAPIGDVDGDGFADVALGAPHLDFVGAPDAGSIDVRRGAAGKPRAEPLVVIPTPLYETPRNRRQAVTIEGDHDGDGRADLFHGRPSSPSVIGGYARAGMAEVRRLAGAPGTTTQVRVYSEDQVDRHLGTAVGMCDWNNLGATTPLLGSPGDINGGVVDAGLIQLRGAWQSRGLIEGGRLGAAAAGVGDVNGDGFGDFLVGAPGARRSLSEPRVGSATLYLGGMTSYPLPSQVLIAPAWSAFGDVDGGELGATVAGLGDIDGDGFTDAAIWARGREQVWLVRGGRGTLTHEAIDAPVPGEGFGAAITAAGDIDGDRRGDVLIAAPDADGGRGRVYVYADASAPLEPTDVLTGGVAGDRFGAAIATAGDLDLDGYADVVIGAPGADAGGLVDVGRVVVLRGSASGLVHEPWWTVEGDRAGASLGDVVAGGGDLDGDAVGDLVIGARDLAAAADAPDAQRLFVYRGNGPQAEAREPRPAATRLGSPYLISPGGRSNHPGAFIVRMFGASPFGRGRVALEVVASRVGGPASPPITTRSGWVTYEGDEVELRATVEGLEGGTTWSWRARVLYDPARAAPQAASRWYHGGAPGQPSRAHVRTRDNAAPTPAGDAYRCQSDVGLDVGPPGLLGNDKDLDGDTNLVTSHPDGAREGPSAHGTVTIAADGGFVYRPEPGFVGRDGFTYRVDDGVGGSALTDVTIVVVPAGCSTDAVERCEAGAVHGVVARGAGASSFVCRVVDQAGSRTLRCDTDARGDLILGPATCAP